MDDGRKAHTIASSLESVIPEQREKPDVTPTLVIGLGGTGTGAIRYLKRRLVWLWHRDEIEREMANVPRDVDPKAWEKEVWHRFEMEGGPPVIQLLAVDTWPWANRPGQVYLNDFEYAYIGGYNANRVLQNLKRHEEIADWWRWDPEETRPGQIHSGARQIRAIGRLSFYRRYRDFWRKLKPRIDQMTSLQAKQETLDRGYQVTSAGETKRVFIIGSLCGGTGAGCLLDVVACLRGVANFGEACIITGVFVLPSVFVPVLGSSLQRDRVRANAYGALKEISYFQSNEFNLWLPGEDPMSIPIMYNRLYLVELVNKAGESLNSIDDVQQLIANQIFLESITDVGARIWEYDVNVTMERRTHEGRLRSYIFSSFANSSMVVPRDDMYEYCELCYASEIIENLLREPSPDEANGINSDAWQTLGRLRDLVDQRGECGIDEEEEIEFFEDGETQDSGGRSDLTLAPLEQFRQDVNEALRKYGIIGGIRFVERIIEVVEDNLGMARQSVDRATKQAEQDSSLFYQRQSAPPRAARWNVWPFSMFVRAAVGTYRREIAALRRAVEEAQASIGLAARERDGWSRLQGVLSPLLGQLKGRADLVRATLEEGLRLDMARLFEVNKASDQAPFEMFTMLLGLPYVRDTLYPGIQESLARQLATDTQYLLTLPAVCQVEQTTSHLRAVGGRHFETVLAVVPTERSRVKAAVQAAARPTIKGAITKEQFHIRTVLKFRNADMHSRLRDLFTRCQPFWRYDLDRGGHSESDMEEIVYAGVAEKDHDEWKYLLRDFTAFEKVEIADPFRIDACRVVHGLPVEYLESLPEMKGKYDRTIVEHAGPMQLDARWERNGEKHLPEIVLPDDRPVMPSSAPPESTAVVAPVVTAPETEETMEIPLTGQGRF